MNVSPYIAREIEREFRSAILHGVSANEVCMARALFDVNAIEVRSHRVRKSVAQALGAAARLNNLMPSQVRRMYGNGYGLHDQVNEAVALSAIP